MIAKTVALGLDDEGKREQETRSLRKVPDAFKKIVIVKDAIVPHYDEFGLFHIGITDFLLDPNSLNA